MDQFLHSWHVYRLPLLVVALILFGIVQAFRLRRRQQRNLQSSSEDFQFPETKPLLRESNSGAFPSRLDDVAGSNSHLRAAVVGAEEKQRTPKRINGKKFNKTKNLSDPKDRLPIQSLVFYASLAGSTEKAAQEVVASISQDSTDKQRAQFLREPQLLDLSNIEYDDYFTGLPKTSISTGPVRYFYLILLPTYDIDTIINTFLQHLNETHHDFRVDSEPLNELAGYSVFGFGDKQGWPDEEGAFCSQAREVDVWLSRLTGRKRAYPLGFGDVHSGSAIRLQEWSMGVRNVILDLAAGNSLGDGVPGSGDALESEDEDEYDASLQGKRRGKINGTVKDSRSIADLESIGANEQSTADDLVPKDFTRYNTFGAGATQAPKEMVPKSSPTYAALTKQGYTIVGSHSGVKICRWTKSALRGRGSCYKFSFYGIKSHLCMETTPSLSCSNKCVFCWRHGTNPVGTTWRWQVDPPEAIFQGVKEGHYKKIKMMRGVPGVRAERFEEAMRIRHCALSLVGEPIFYPHINAFTALLHAERISSFLVCNAQHPDQLATLQPVTQLYVSIDASNAEALRKIDRPLHRDFWERFCRCLDIIREKRFRQRTVYRLTLVKGFNVEDEAEGYADLVQRGLPCFVEIKGVTYCGTSAASGAGLTMANVPFYAEVCVFVRALDAALAARGLEYGIAAEHEHSCCVLLASKRFLVGGEWCTTIDYEAFFKCLESGEEFAPEDYMAPTPQWALWGNGGFDPADERVYRKGAKKGRVEVNDGK